jgi:tol-pal system protein YbgF
VKLGFAWIIYMQGGPVMKNWWKVILPLLILFIFQGCASSVKKTQEASAVQKEIQQQREKTLLERIERNSAAINDIKNAMTALQQRIKDLEDRVNTEISNENAVIQETRDNITFLKDQVLRLDNSIQVKTEPLTGEKLLKPKSSKAAGVFKPDGFKVDEAYREALSNYYARKFDTAIAGFTEILTVAPGNKISINAQYWIGECYYSKKNYDKALEAFKKILSLPLSNKTADAHVKIGMTHMMTGDKAAAREEFNLVISKYPGSNAAKIAEVKLSLLGDR